MYIESRLRLDEWTDRDGKPRYTLEVHATDVQFLNTGDRNDSQELRQARFSDRESPEPELSDDDIPF